MAIGFNSRILVLGSSGLVGSAFMRFFSKKNYRNTLGCNSLKIDLKDRAKTRNLVSEFQPDLVIMAAGEVGGIRFNIDKGHSLFVSNNLMQRNILEASCDFKVPELLFFASNSIYPANALQPMTESMIGSGELEPVLRPFGTAKLAGIRLIDQINSDKFFSYKTVIAANLYGPNDNFHPINSHALQGLIRKLHLGKVQNSPYVTLWGDGTPKREFLHSDDLVSASMNFLNCDSKESLINVGSGEEISIYDLAKLVAEQVGYSGEIRWETSSPNGSLRRVLDSSKIIELGWKPSISLEPGVSKHIMEFLKANS
jgi:GDP-L-fucose synthase